MYRFRRENKCDENGCCSVRCNSLFLCERKDKQREIREIREIREDALLKKGLAENFQPLRAKRAQRQTTTGVSCTRCCLIKQITRSNSGRKTANVYQIYPLHTNAVIKLSGNSQNPTNKKEGLTPSFYVIIAYFKKGRLRIITGSFAFPEQIWKKHIN